MSALMDIWHAIQGIVTSADYWTLGIAVLVAIAAGFVIQGLNSVVTATFWALIGFAALCYVRAVTLGGQNITTYADVEWHKFLSLGMLTLAAYAIIFAVLIAVVHVIRSAVR